MGLPGGGKSTIASLAARLRDATQSEVLLGGVSIKNISEKNLNNCISIVFQENSLLKMSIADNVVLYKPESGRNAVNRALHLAQCDDIIAKLPDGIDTQFGSKGVYLSGGEIQRIAIARAILKDSPVIILDEATAFADAENEYLIRKAFEELLKNKTVIMIAHRMSTVRNEDKICVVENGKIIEEGNHITLMNLKGKYASMVNEYSKAISWKIGNPEKKKKKLSVMKNLTKGGRRAIYKSSAWLATFQIIAMLPLYLIYQAVGRIFGAYKDGTKADFLLAFTFALATAIVFALYLAYRKMHKAKYLSASKENSTLRMGLADKLRQLPESFRSKHDLSDLTSTIMDDIGIMEGILANQLTEFIGGFIGIAVTVVVLFFVNIKMSLALLSVVPLAVIAMALCDPISGRTHQKNRNIKLSISDGIQEYLENIKVLGIIPSRTYSVKAF